MSRRNAMLRPALALLVSTCAALGQQAPRAPTPEEGAVGEAGGFHAANPASTNQLSSEHALREQLTVRRVGPDALVVGNVDIDAAARTVSFPARVNMREGIVEYAVVHESGKVHESIFATKVKPEEVHLACLLLGATNAPAAVGVEVTWDRGDEHARYRLDELLRVSGAPMSTGAWHYVGSLFDAGGFVASAEGSIVSVIRDAGALMDNPRPEAVDDTVHTPFTERLPADGAPVRVHLILPKPAP